MGVPAGVTEPKTASVRTVQTIFWRGVSDVAVWVVSGSDYAMFTFVLLGSIA
jgi:hypothetical protein